ncbi:kif-2, putative [Pediculus humanus corporis]|uniref:Kinesin-like protein n=1 Tax=Pediculus humanus subsp. corporis TaxID=121224 RepID=E0VQJ3_PEDHC|nr:kif-2, putative [Pediculus humanus corporis]EEB15649.1 kif-2, putative [Pediculus humanus corporis]
MIHSNMYIYIYILLGRVHSAVVSGVNWNNRSVTVEWFEHGETKGKELPVDQILSLNPDLCPEPYYPHNTAPASNSNSTGGINRMRLNFAKLGVPQNLSNGVPSGGGVPPRQVRNRPNSNITNGHGVPSDYTSKETEILQISQHQQPSTPNAVHRITPTFAVPQARTNTTQALITAQQTRSMGNTGHQIDQASTLPVANPAVTRRSNVVKEVEKLKKNREERRLRQAELKEEKEALMNSDPGEYRSNLEFRPLKENDTIEDHQITVCVRKRPLNKKEINRKEIDVVTVPTKDQIVVHEPKNKFDLTKYLENQNFRFDYAFDDSCNNETVYKFTAKPLVQTVFEGGMATCFAYGQTGSGKTHTMGGDFNGKTQDCKKGIYAMVAKDFFKFLNSPKYRSLKLIVSASFFEIYSGKVFDLLADKAKLRVLEDGKNCVQIVGLTEKVVENVDEVLKLIQHGNSVRTSGQTSANSNSSRSHAVFQIIVRTPGVNKIYGKFSLIDLAGNERGADTSSSNRQTRMEGAEINKSLLALKECIRALGRKGAHLPFRASKLTQVLRDSFIGEKSKTCMIAMISPGMSSCEHSLNTLRYADRVKELAVTEPPEKISPTDGGSPEVVERAMLNDSDLAQLRSLNEGELSADLYNFHEVVSQLQQQEDEVLDLHKEVIDFQSKWFKEDIELLNSTREVDYDQEVYSTRLQNLIKEKMNIFRAFDEKVASFRDQLVAEEQFSQKVKPRPGRFN